MEEQEIYTITIVRNIGIPISFTIKRWKVIFFVALLAVVSMLLLAGSIDYLFLKLEANELAKELTSVTKKTELLTEQIARLDHDRYWINEDEKNKELTTTRETILAQRDFSTEGIWITSKPTLSEEESQEGMFIEVERFNSMVKGDVLNLTINLLNTSNPPQPLMGYICVTLVNNDQLPPLYRAVGGGQLGESGFPSSYNSGKPYFIKRQTGSSQLKFELTSVNEYYTDALVFLFSVKGTLLNKGQYPLNKEIFLD